MTAVAAFDVGDDPVPVDLPDRQSFGATVLGARTMPNDRLAASSGTDLRFRTQIPSGVSATPSCCRRHVKTDPRAATEF